MIRKNLFFMVKKYAKVLSQMGSRSTKILIRTGEGLFETKDDADFSDLCEDGLLPVTDDKKYPAECAVLLAAEEGAAVVRSETNYCMAAAQHYDILRASLDDMAQIIGPQVETVPSQTEAVVSALQKAEACFVRGRYTVTFGRSLFEAVTALSVLEKSAEVTLKAEVIGGVVPLETAEAHRLRAQYLEHYSCVEAEAKRKEGMG